jgi:cyclase
MKRIIFTLLYGEGAFHLSRNFRLQRIGDADWLERNYDFSRVGFAIDELVVLDVSRGARSPEDFAATLIRTTRSCFAPVAAGGGVRTVDDARRLLRSGADKVVVNTATAEDPGLATDLARAFGAQCVVASVDAVRTEAGHVAVVDRGGREVGPLRAHLDRIGSLPVGELLLTSVDRDGTGQGLDLGLLDEVPASVRCPVILSGGIGFSSHIHEGLTDPRVDAVATANLLNFVGDGLERARSETRDHGSHVAHFDAAEARRLAGVAAATAGA